LPAVTPLRLANVPTPKGTPAVSPPVTVTQSSGTPSASAATWANDRLVALARAHGARATARGRGVEGDARALEGADGGTLDVAGDADAAPDPARAQRLLLLRTRVRTPRRSARTRARPGKSPLSYTSGLPSRYGIPKSNGSSSGRM